jgi:hypothetical protein
MYNAFMEDIFEEYTEEEKTALDKLNELSKIRLDKIDSFNQDIKYNIKRLLINMSYKDKDLILFNKEELKYEYFNHIEYEKAYKKDIYNYNSYLDTYNRRVPYKIYYLVYHYKYNITKKEKLERLNSITNFFKPNEKEFFIKYVNHIDKENQEELFTLYVNEFDLHAKEEVFNNRLQAILNKFRFHFEFLDYLKQERSDVYFRMEETDLNFFDN